MLRASTDGKGVWHRTDTCIWMAESLHFIWNYHNIVNWLYTNFCFVLYFVLVLKIIIKKIKYKKQKKSIASILKIMSAGPQWRVCSCPHWPRLCRWLTPSALEEDTGSAPGHLHHLFGQLPHGGLDFRDLYKTLHGLHHFCALLQGTSHSQNRWKAKMTASLNTMWHRME